MSSIALVLVVFTASLAGASSFDTAFERLKTLEGTWDVEGADRHVVYYLTGGGETVVEDFRGERPMATYYHRDGAELMLTHFCNAGSQPRMKAVSYDEARGVLKFEYLDITNHTEPRTYHTRDLEVRFLGPDRIELEYIGREEGRPVSSVFTLTRIAR